MTPEFWNHIRTIYKKEMPNILGASKERRRGRIDPYFVDWMYFMTPIEERAWTSIRCIGVPLYPQFPALDYFLDFANPYFKIGLELDGKPFHDTEKDRIRDQRLFDEEGWKIFRATGREASVNFKTPEEFEAGEENTRAYREALNHWLGDTADGLIRSIDLVYFLDQRDAYEGACIECLEMHRLARFVI